MFTWLIYDGYWQALCKADQEKLEQAFGTNQTTPVMIGYTKFDAYVKDRKATPAYWKNPAEYTLRRASWFWSNNDGLVR